MATLPSCLGGGLSSIAVTGPVTLSPPSILDRWVETPHVSPVSSAACFGACFLSVSVRLPPLPFSPGRPSPACWVISCQLGPISYLFSLIIEEDTDRNLRIFFPQVLHDSQVPHNGKGQQVGDRAFRCGYKGCGRLYTTAHHLKVRLSHTRFSFTDFPTRL